MRFVLLFSFFSINVSAFSQITLSVTDFADVGDTVRMSRVNDAMIDFSSTGQNFNWDFSQLVPESQFVKDYTSIFQSGFGAFLFGPFAPAEFQASYFTEDNASALDQLAQFLPIGITDAYSVEKLDATALTRVGYLLGVQDNLLAVRSDSIEIMYTLPLNYGDSYSSVGHLNFELQPVYNGAWLQHREHTAIVDGYGQITTPYGSFNALRIKHEILEYDSLLLDFNGSSFWVPINVPPVYQYEWWTNNEKVPILKITTNEVFGDEVVTAIEYRDFYRGLDAGLDEQEIQMTLGPNPTEGSFTIQAEQPIQNIRVLFSDGRVIYARDGLNDHEITVDLEHLSAGPFFVEIRCADQLRTLPLVLR
ncbi:MAG: hypothetical protein ACK45H_06690 [Bacteroidota bacterium]|jgi:hypothetical protein